MKIENLGSTTPAWKTITYWMRLNGYTVHCNDKKISITKFAQYLSDTELIRLVCDKKILEKAYHKGFYEGSKINAKKGTL